MKLPTFKNRNAAYFTSQWLFELDKCIAKTKYNFINRLKKNHILMRMI